MKTLIVILMATAFSMNSYAAGNDVQNVSKLSVIKVYECGLETLYLSFVRVSDAKTIRRIPIQTYNANPNNPNCEIDKPCYHPDPPTSYELCMKDAGRLNLR